MILDRRLCRAVIALYDCSCIVELFRHRLTLDCLSQLLPLQVHANSALLAYGALVGSLHVEVVAALVQIVTTRHGDYSGRGSEEVIAANGTVAFGGAGEAFVRCSVRYGYADIAALAVIEVFAQTFASSTDTAVWTMVDFFLAVVVPQLADIAIVACSLQLAVVAVFGCLLRCAARHA
jgi:hypothetical protein